MKNKINKTQMENKINIFTVSKQNGERERIFLAEAKQRLEPKYYEAGTIENLLKDKKDFTLETSFFIYHFNF